MRSRTIEFGGKDIRVTEKRIGELEKAVADLFPESKGGLQNIQIESLIDHIGFDLLYDKLPLLIPEISAEDVKNAYMSEIEELIEVFIDVNFQGLKRLIKPLLSLMSTSLLQNQPQEEIPTG